MKRIRSTVLTGLFFITLFSGKVCAQTGNVCDYPDLLSGKILSLDKVIYSPGWQPSENYLCTWKNEKLSLYLGDKTLDAWQAQFFLSVSSAVVLIQGETYCITFDIETNVDLPRVFMKCYKEGNDDRFIELTDNSVKKGKQTVSAIYVNKGNTMVAEINKILFDFGYNPAKASIVISNITIRGNNDITGNGMLRRDDIKVFPNPVNDRLFIQGVAYDSRVSILNMHGTVCIDQLSTKEIDVSGLERGIYFVMVAGKIFKIIKY